MIRLLLLGIAALVLYSQWPREENHDHTPSTMSKWEKRFSKLAVLIGWLVWLGAFCFMFDTGPIEIIESMW